MNETISAAPSRPHVAEVDSREELIYLLSRASELEHDLACMYLYAAYSLKSDLREGEMTADEFEHVRSWKQKLAHVAVQEMLHLAQVSNLLTAIGGAPHFRRSNFPVPATAFPLGIDLSLDRFSPALIDRLVCCEMPEADTLSQLEEPLQSECNALLGRVAIGVHDRVAAAPAVHTTEPFDVDFKTVAELYHKIETGFRTIAQDQLFIGPAEAQANAKYLDEEGQLIAALDRDSALRAIKMIIDQGEAPRNGVLEDSHFWVFSTIRTEFEKLTALARAQGRVFEPARPVVSNPVTRFFGADGGRTRITDPLAQEVADLFNSAYDTMLLMLMRFFAHIEESEEELRMLARGTLRVMASVLRPLAEALTKMPAGDAYPGKTAGPGFGFNRDVHLLAHKRSAWIFFLERLWELAGRTTILAQDESAPPEIAEAAAALESVAEHLMPFVPSAYAEHIKMFACTSAAEVSIRPELNGPYLVMNMPELTNSKGETLRTRPVVALCRCGGSAIKPYCDGTHASIGFESAKKPERTPDHLARYPGAQITVTDNRGTCCHFGNCTDHVPQVFGERPEGFVRPDAASKQEIIDAVRACPSGALGYVLDGIEYAGEQREPSIYVSQNGPYHVRGGIDLHGTQRNDGASREHYALCRCGRSKNKPFCDGSHWGVFVDEDN